MDSLQPLRALAALFGLGAALATAALAYYGNSVGHSPGVVASFAACVVGGLSLAVYYGISLHLHRRPPPAEASHTKRRAIAGVGYALVATSALFPLLAAWLVFTEDVGLEIAQGFLPGVFCPLMVGTRLLHIRKHGIARSA
ncbi:hypothetical protein LG943_24030 [Streptomonospora sp. S1-112]|uniref:Uncharacterized protein n=1 Tax=Streptomonospora mangrovi TaxID=2883123 RepID=A0A9X3P008_9ACTN|nr:hypothetical protein [Streptomonospora mangrovi]MDA0567366.1 hypothetical protein [Streptomonospora mangrovi]